MRVQNRHRDLSRRRHVHRARAGVQPHAAAEASACVPSRRHARVHGRQGASRRSRSAPRAGRVGVRDASGGKKTHFLLLFLNVAPPTFATCRRFDSKEPKNRRSRRSRRPVRGRELASRRLRALWLRVRRAGVRMLTRASILWAPPQRLTRTDPSAFILECSRLARSTARGSSSRSVWIRRSPMGTGEAPPPTAVISPAYHAL